MCFLYPISLSVNFFLLLVLIAILYEFGLF